MTTSLSQEVLQDPLGRHPQASQEDRDADQALQEFLAKVPGVAGTEIAPKDRGRGDDLVELFAAVPETGTWLLTLAGILLVQLRSTFTPLRGDLDTEWRKLLNSLDLDSPP